jgi:lipopolysaccharide export system protein LptA
MLAPGALGASDLEVLDLTVSGNDIQFAGGGWGANSKPMINFNQGGSKIYDDMHLRIETDDNLYLSAGSAVYSSTFLPHSHNLYNLGESQTKWHDAYFGGTVNTYGLVVSGPFMLGGSHVDASAAEIDILDGATLSTAELNLLDGVTATTAELNYVDGVTSAIQTQLNGKLPLAGGTMTGELVAYNAATSASTTEGALYYDTDDDNLYVYASGSFVDLTAGAAGSNSLDDAYNTDSGERTIIGDDGAISWDMSGAYNFIVDLQATGDFVIQDAGVAAVTVSDTGVVTVAGSAEGTGAVVLTAGDLTVTDGDLTLSGGEVAVTTDDTTTDAVTITGNTLTTGQALAVIYSSTAHTSGNIFEVSDSVNAVDFAVAEDGATTITGAAEGTAALTLTTGDVVVTDGDLTLSGGEFSATTGATTGVGHALNVSTITTGQGIRITYDESNLAGGTILEAYGADDTTVDWSVGEDGATVIRGSAEGTASLTQTTGDHVITDGDLTLSGGELSVTTDDTTTDAATVNGNTLTTGQTLALTYDASTHTTGNVFDITDNDAGVDFAVAEDGATTITGSAEGTAALTLTAGDIVVTNGDVTLSGGELAVTTGETTGDAASVNGNTLTTGQALALTYDASVHTSGNIFDITDNDASVDFAVAEDGATTITGSAEGTAALTLTAGNLVVTDGDLTLSGGEVTVTTDDTTTDAFVITGNTLTTGQTLALTYDASAHTSGNVFEISDNDAGVDFAVAEDGATTITGSAEGTAALTLTTGDIIVTDGDLTLSGGEVSVTGGAGEGTSALTVVAGDLTLTDGDLILTASEVTVTTDDTTTDAFVITGNTLTTGQTLALTYDASTHTSGNVFEISDNDSAVDFAVAEDGATTITGSAEGAAALTLTTGDVVVTDGDLTLSGGELAVTGATAHSITSSAGAITLTAGAASVWSTTAGNLTLASDAGSTNIIFDPANGAAGALLPEDNGEDSIGADATRWSTVFAQTFNFSSAITDDNSGNTTVTLGDSNSLDTVTITANTAITDAHWSISEAGAATFETVVADGTAEGTAAVTLTTGDVLVSDGDLTLSGGEVAVTTDDTTTDAATITGNTLTTGQTLALTYDASTHTSGNVFDISDNDAGVDFAVAEDGATTITGSAEGTGALTLTTGDVVVTDGDITVSGGELALTTDDTTTDAVVINGNTLTTGQAVAISYDASTHTSGNVFEISDNDAAVDFAVAEDGATTLTGNADGTAVLTLTAGDLDVTDGDLDVAGGDFNVVLDAADSASVSIDGATAATAALTVANTTAASDTSGSEGLDVALTVTNYGDDGAADTHTGLDVLVTSNTSDAGTDDIVYGIRVQNLGGGADGGAEYGIYQAGTTWDYGLYVSDDVHFNTKVNLGSQAVSADPDAGAVTITAAFVDWTPAGEGTATFADGNAGDFFILINEHATNAITLSDGAGNIQSAAEVLSQYDAATFLHNGTDWILIATADNSP